jgi:hypothetical protein
MLVVEIDGADWISEAGSAKSDSVFDIGAHFFSQQIRANCENRRAEPVGCSPQPSKSFDVFTITGHSNSINLTISKD